MAASYTPQFFFQANRIRQSTEIRSIVNTFGMWFPPRALGGSQIREGQSTNRIFHFNGGSTQEIVALPIGVQLYRTVSMYYSQGNFFLVPYDCTTHQVANGRPNHDNRESSDDTDAEGEDEDILEPDRIDWSLLRFNWGERYISEAWFGANHPHLNTQRPDQRWVNQILTNTYRAEFSRRTSDPRYGGLNGDLGILIGLLALSANDAAVTDIFQHCVRAVHTPDGGWRSHNQQDEEGWIDRRGFVIHVWSFPGQGVTDAHLHALEKGDQGNIWR